MGTPQDSAVCIHGAGSGNVVERASQPACYRGKHRNHTRTFVRLRVMIGGQADLIRRLDQLEARYDEQFRAVFEAIRTLITLETRPVKRIGFRAAAP